MGGQSSPLVTSPTNRWKNPNPDKPSKISIQSFWHFFEPFFFVILNQNFLRPSAALPAGPTLFQWTRTGGSAAWLGGCGSAPLRLGQVFQSGWIDSVPFLPFVPPSMGVGKKFFFCPEMMRISRKLLVPVANFRPKKPWDGPWGIQISQKKVFFLKLCTINISPS